MRSKRNHAATIIAILFACSAFGPSANAAPADDACALVTAAQVSAAIGIPVSAGTYVTPGYLKTCTFTASGDSAKSVSAVTISYQAADGYAAAKSMMEMAKARMTTEQNKNAAQFANTSASGIGDDAFYTSMGANYTGLLVKKGNVSFKVAIYGGLSPEKKMAAEKTLALQAISKL